MKITDLDIIGQIERLAEAFPWDVVDIWLQRDPEGKYRFTAYLHQNDRFGFSSDFGHGETPNEAAEDLIKRANQRDPEIARKSKVAELMATIERLQAVVIGLPPYRPNRELCYGNPAIRVNETVEVCTVKTETPAARGGFLLHNNFPSTKLPPGEIP